MGGDLSGRLEDAAKRRDERARCEAALVGAGAVGFVVAHRVAQRAQLFASPGRCGLRCEQRQTGRSRQREPIF